MCFRCDVHFAQANAKLLTIDGVTANAGLLDWSARAADSSDTEQQAATSVPHSISSPTSVMEPFFGQTRKSSASKYDESDLWATRPPDDLSAAGEIDMSVEPTAASSSALRRSSMRMRHGQLNDSSEGLDLLFNPDVVCGHGGTAFTQLLVVTFSGTLALCTGSGAESDLFKLPNLLLHKASGPPMTLVPDVRCEDARFAVQHVRGDREATLRRKEPQMHQHVALRWREYRQLAVGTSKPASADIVKTDSAASDASLESAVLRAGSPELGTGLPVCGRVFLEIFHTKDGLSRFCWNMDLHDVQLSQFNLTFSSPVSEAKASAGGIRVKLSLGSQAAGYKHCLRIQPASVPPSAKSLSLQWTRTTLAHTMDLPTCSIAIDRLDITVNSDANLSWAVCNDALTSTMGMSTSSPNTIHVFGVPAAHHLSLAAQDSALDSPNDTTLKDEQIEVADLVTAHSKESVKPSRQSWLAWTLFLLVTGLLFFFADHHQKAIRHLQSEVELLSLAANVDFRQGYWSESPPSDASSPSAITSDDLGSMITRGVNYEPDSALEDAAHANSADLEIVAQQMNALQLHSPVNSLALVVFSPLLVLLDAFKRFVGIFA